MHSGGNNRVLHGTLPLTEAETQGYPVSARKACTDEAKLRQIPQPKARYQSRAFLYSKEEDNGRV